MILGTYMQIKGVYAYMHIYITQVFLDKISHT